VAVDIGVRPGPPPVGAERGALQILHEDDDLLVVVKPPGVVVHPTAVLRQGTLLNALVGHAADSAGPGWTPHLVQRLDKDTSGVLAVAKSAAAHAVLQRAATDTVKEYLAIVWGAPTPTRGTLDGALGRDPLDRRRVMVRATGTPASTRYARLGRSSAGRGISLVACRLLTGRTHQIRVHLAERGWSIVGDAVYGQPPRRRLDDVALDRAARAFPRQALHAWRLTLPLPSSGRLRRFEAPVPPDLTALLAAAGLAVPSWCTTSPSTSATRLYTLGPNVRS
jgi:23S rRNA pseudouridine1911/1915/1917 synthase